MDIHPERLDGGCLLWKLVFGAKERQAKKHTATSMTIAQPAKYYETDGSSQLPFIAFALLIS